MTSVAKRVPCLSQFFARYKDIFGRWFVVTPQITITDPPGTLDFESLQKKARFDQDINLSRGGVYNPNAIDHLVLWLGEIVAKKWSSTNWLTKLVTLTQVNILHPN